MSWFTDFRDSALIGIGLKKGRNAAKVLGNVARPAFQTATAPQAPKNQAGKTPTAAAGGFSISAFLKQNSWVGIVIMGGGLLLLKKAFNK